jgi:hypothetical protein
MYIFFFTYSATHFLQISTANHCRKYKNPHVNKPIRLYFSKCQLHASHQMVYHVKQERHWCKSSNGTESKKCSKWRWTSRHLLTRYSFKLDFTRIVHVYYRWMCGRKTLFIMNFGRLAKKKIKCIFSGTYKTVVKLNKVCFYYNCNKYTNSIIRILTKETYIVIKQAFFLLVSFDALDLRYSSYILSLR